MPIELQVLAVLILTGIVGYFFRKWAHGLESQRKQDFEWYDKNRQADSERYIASTDKLTDAIDKLDTTIDTHNATLMDFKMHTETRLAAVEETAIRYERQQLCNVADLADHDGRLTILETKHALHHPKDK